jgi:hypothetical protein
MEYIETDTICNLQCTTTFRLTGNQARQLIKGCYEVHYSPLNRDEIHGDWQVDDYRRKEFNETLFYLLTLPIGTKVSLSAMVADNGLNYDSIKFKHLKLPPSENPIVMNIYCNETDTPFELAQFFLFSKSFTEFKLNMSMIWLYFIGKEIIA